MIIRVVLITLLVSFSLSYMEAADTTSIDFVEPFSKRFTKYHEEDIDWISIKIPENWQEPEYKIELAVARINSLSDSIDRAVLFLEGGPGFGGISRIQFWLDHPIRESRDIILLDIRGTGFSSPRLCKGFGKLVFEVMSKDQTVTQDESQRVDVANECLNSVKSRKIDISHYDIDAVIKDMHALK